MKPLYKANFEITALYVIIRLSLVYKKERSIYKIIPAALQDVMYPNFTYAKNDAEQRVDSLNGIQTQMRVLALSFTTLVFPLFIENTQDILTCLLSFSLQP